ncbi:MAG TPA: hypothetical protein PK295_00275 [Candidatus Magasanikbacteria bacterium]|nr:hypothetical protein [Candidatus Magasanikbacteria bacterium]
MEKNIQFILEELYQIDPELKSHEIEIAQIVERMIQNKPNTQLDETFARELKSKVLEKFSHQTVKETKSFSFFRSKFVYTLSGAIATLAIAFPVVYFSTDLSAKFLENSFTAGTRVVRAEANAFGPLSPVTVNASNTEGAQPQVSNMALGMGGDSSKRMDTSMIYNPVYTNYNFTFSGELPELSGDIEVLKRESGIDAAKQYAGILQKIKLGIFDLGKLKQAQVQNFSLAEDRDKGYIINVDMVGGYVSISENYSKWHTLRTEIDCVNGMCSDPNMLSIDEVPEDSTLTNVSDAFLKEYGIDMSSYGKGVVDSRWRVGYEAAEDKSAFYISNIQTVVYQLMINDKPVYEEYGEPMGIRVNINTQEMKVTNVEGIMTKTFSGSSYEGETDEARLRAIIEKARMVEYAEPTKTVDGELENATLGYMRRWQYNETNGNSTEIFVPAIIVEVKDFERLQAEGLWQSKVIIPLAKEMLSELENQEPIQIMPFEPMFKDAVINPVPMSEPAVEPRG